MYLYPRNVEDFKSRISLFLTGPLPVAPISSQIWSCGLISRPLHMDVVQAVPLTTKLHTLVLSDEASETKTELTSV